MNFQILFFFSNTIVTNDINVEEKKSKFFFCVNLHPISIQLNVNPILIYFNFIQVAFNDIQYFHLNGT
jgi:hypothetical protein